MTTKIKFSGGFGLELLENGKTRILLDCAKFLADPVDYPIVEIGRERNEAGEPLVHVGGALCGTLANWKKLIAEFERVQEDAPFAWVEGNNLPLYDPRKDSTVGGEGNHRWQDHASFSEAVIAVVRDAQKRRIL